MHTIMRPQKERHNVETSKGREEMAMGGENEEHGKILGVILLFLNGGTAFQTGHVMAPARGT